MKIKNLLKKLKNPISELNTHNFGSRTKNRLEQFVSQFQFLNLFLNRIRKVSFRLKCPLESNISYKSYNHVLIIPCLQNDKWIVGPENNAFGVITVKVYVHPGVSTNVRESYSNWRIERRFHPLNRSIILTWDRKCRPVVDKFLKFCTRTINKWPVE